MSDTTPDNAVPQGPDPQQPPAAVPVTPIEAQAPATAPAGEAPATRRRLPVPLLVVLALLVVAIAATAGYFGMMTITRTQRAERDVAKASSLLEAAEPDLLRVDDAVQVEITSASTTQTTEAMDLATTVHEKVAQAASLVTSALPNLPDDQVALAKALKESAEARAEMMTLAPVILEADRKAATAIGYADQAVAEIKAAEDLTAKAVIEFNNHTAASVKTSDDYSVQAESRLNAAQSLIASATASFPGADFTPFSNYIAAKISLIALAKEIDALWLAGNIAGSNAKLDAYNQRDAEVVALAKALPSSVRDPIANAYNEATAADTKRYFDARERARSAGDLVGELRQTAAKTE